LIAAARGRTLDEGHFARRTMRAPTGWLLLTSLVGSLAAGCSDHAGGHGDGGAPGIDGLKSIDVTPPNLTLVIDGMTAATQSYHASGHFNDGHTEDITSRVAFALGDGTLGTFSGNAFVSGTDHGGVTAVLASAGNILGQTPLTLTLRERANDPSSTLPANPGAKFGGAANTAFAPQLVYPNDGALVPPNLGKLEIHFKPAAGTTLFAIDFQNPATDVEVYASCTNPTGGGCIYLPDPTVWHWIAESNRGGGPLAITVRATDAQGSGTGTSGALSIRFSQDDIHGGLYYWTTSGQTAIMRFDFASTTQTAGQQFIGTQFSGGTCVGCHALSHDGKKLVAEAGGQNDGRLLLMDVASTMPIVAFGSPPKSIFESWNATGDRYVGVYGDSGATDYNLMLFDGASGAHLGDIAGTGTQARPADHPDWSLDGKKLAYVAVGGPGTMQRMWSGAIELITTTDGVTWTAPVELVASQPDKNHYYPSISPDGSFLLYDESTCPPGANRDIKCDADTDPTATIWAILTSAGSQPVALAKVNAPGIMDAGKTALTNSFPRWSPFVFQRAAGENVSNRLEWVTFSSTRNYGLRPPPPSATGDESPTGTFLWMAAVDPDAVANGQDGSYAAFALPFQDLTTSNHIAQWTTQVVPPIM
jgi:hypothetical protein